MADATLGVVDDGCGLDFTTDALGVVDATIDVVRVVVDDDTTGALVDERVEVRAEPSPAAIGELVESAAIPRFSTGPGLVTDRDDCTSPGPTGDDGDTFGTFGPDVETAIRAGWLVPGATYTGSDPSPAGAVSDAVSVRVAIGLLSIEPATFVVAGAGGGFSRFRAFGRGTAGTGEESLCCATPRIVGR